MITRFLRNNVGRLAILTSLAGVNAGAAFLALTAINRVTTASTSLTTLIQAVLLIALLLGSAALTQKLSAALGADFVNDLRSRFAERLLIHPYVPGSSQQARGLSAFINDIAEISPLALVAPQIAYNALFALVATGYLFFLSIPMATIVVAVLAILMSLSAFIARLIPAAFGQLRQADDNLVRTIHQLEQARKELLTNRQRADHFFRFVVTPSIAASRARMAAAHARVGYFQAWSSNLLYVTIILTTLIGTTLVPVPPGQLASFIVGCLILVGPVNALVGAAQQISRATAAAQRLDRFTSEYASEPTRHVPTGRFAWDTLSFEGVSYSYDDNDRSRTVLGPMDFTILRGETIFVVGKNGSGKTTLLMLLSGLLAPTKGRISIDHRPIEEIKADFRAMLSVVFCDFHLFEHLLDAQGCLAENADLEQRIRALGLENIVEVTEGKLSTINASAGQRKRLALLQLMLEDRNILILDEIAADLDPQFKHYFYTEVITDLKQRGKTIIIATHDSSYFSCADRLFELKGGWLRQATEPNCND